MQQEEDADGLGANAIEVGMEMVSPDVEQVYHLKGGILKYLEEVPEVQSKWQGRCFVFDERESLGHGLSESEVVS